MVNRHHVVNSIPLLIIAGSTHLSHFMAKRVLKSLSTVEVVNVGEKLGLNYFRLETMKDETFLGDMLSCWLREDDNVHATSGSPSWESLAKALEETGFSSMAEDIRKCKSSCMLLHMATLLWHVHVLQMHCQEAEKSRLSHILTIFPASYSS